MNSAAAAAKPAAPQTGQGLTYAPILRSSHQQIRELGARRSTSLLHVQQTIEGDAALALNLFADVNANLKRAGRAPVGDIPRAILFMGMAELPGRIARATILEEIAEPALCEDLTCILRRAHHASRQARAIGSLLGGVNGEELLAASLAHEGLPFVEILASQAGSTLNLAAFSNFLPAPPGGHDSNLLTTQCLDLAARFARATEEVWDDTALDPLYTEIGETTGRDAADVARQLRLATVEAARSGTHFGTYPAAIHLMSPGERTRPPATTNATAAGAVPAARPAPVEKPRTRSIPDANKRRVRKSAAPKSSTVKKSPAPAKEPAAPASRPVSASLDALTRAATGGAAALLPIALTEICEQTGMKLALLLTRDKARPDLRLRAHHGLDVPSKYRDVPLALKENRLLEKLMAKPAAFQWMPEKHGAALTGLSLKLMGGKHGFFYSLHVDDQPLGILVACRPASGSADSQRTFAAFKQIGVATRDALQSARKNKPR